MPQVSEIDFKSAFGFWLTVTKSGGINVYAQEPSKIRVESFKELTLAKADSAHPPAEDEAIFTLSICQNGVTAIFTDSPLRVSVFDDHHEEGSKGNGSHPPKQEHKLYTPPQELPWKIGTVMEDGTIFAGLSASIGTPLFIMPTNPMEACAYWDGVSRCKNDLGKQAGGLSFGHPVSEQLFHHAIGEDPFSCDGGWRLPTAAEATENLFLHRHKIKAGLENGGIYWTSSRVPLSLEGPGCNVEGVVIEFNGQGAQSCRKLLRNNDKHLIRLVRTETRNQAR